MMFVHRVLLVAVAAHFDHFGMLAMDINALAAGVLFTFTHAWNVLMREKLPGILHVGEKEVLLLPWGNGKKFALRPSWMN